MTLTKSDDTSLSTFDDDSEKEYWFKPSEGTWGSVSKEKYIREERNAGFIAKGGSDEVATNSFGSSRTNTSGIITRKTNTPEEYDWDPEFAAAMQNHRAGK